MKKVVFIFAFALLSAVTFAAYSSINNNTIITEFAEDEPKSENANTDEETSNKKTDATKSEKKAECTKKKSSSCSKTCGKN
jgi:hypothetical protein